MATSRQDDKYDMIADAVTLLGRATPTRAVVRYLQATWPIHFPSFEGCRSMVRWYRGERVNVRQGSGKVEGCADPIGVRTEEERVEAEMLGAAMPASDAPPLRPYIIPEGCDKVAVWADIHIPYHDVRALETSIKRIKRDPMDAILLLGDVMDWYQASTFCKDLRLRMPVGEVTKYREFIAYIRQYHRGPIYFKEGNHDERFLIFLRNNAPILLGLPQFELPSILGFEEDGVTHIGDREKVEFGHLVGLHGHEFGRGSYNPVNSARGLFLRALHSGFCGHWHQSSDHTERTIGNDLIDCHGVGCLCDLYPQYRRYSTKTNHGYAILHRERGGRERLENVRIHEGEET